MHERAVVPLRRAPVSRSGLRGVVDDRRGVVVALVIAGIFTAVSWLRYANYWAGALDLSIFDQGIWLMSRGHAPEVTVIGRSLFADHLSPVLVLFVPLYRLIPTQLWLYAAQALCLGACVLPMRALARLEGVAPWVATTAVALNSTLAAAAVFDFHPSTLAVPAIAWALLFARRGDTRACTVAAIVVVLCRADLAWVLLGIAVVALPAPRRRLLILTPIALAAGVLIPALAGARGTWDVHYGHLGNSAFDAALHPWRAAAALVSPDALLTLIFWLLPVALLPVLRPRWLLAIVVAGLPILVSRWAGTHLPYFHYGAPMAPLAIGGALHALATRPELRSRGPVLLVGGAVAALAVMSPLSPRAPDSLRLWRVVRPYPPAATAAAIAAVPADLPVSATPQVLAHLAHRREAWIFPTPFRPLKPAALGPEPSARNADRVRTVVVDWSRCRLAEQLGFRVTTIAPGRLCLGQR
jgi:uncharacterized membrane protein